MRTPEQPPAVIVGLNDAAMSIVRSLGQKGIQIIGLHDDNAKEYYISSKYISQKVKTPLAGEPLVSTLVDIARTLREPRVLFCTNDNSVMSVAQNEAQLRPFFRFVIPPYEVANRHISKKGLHEFAQENSFLVPSTAFAFGKREIEEAGDAISFPCIIKPEFRDQTWSEKVPYKVLFAESREDFLQLVEKYELYEISLVIQEWIDGDDNEVYFCLAYLNRNQNPLALCTARKLRQYPHLTGSTSIAETVRVPEIVTESLRFLKTAGCIGFCSVEFKRSKRNGLFYITEPTIGRPDTQEGIFLSAGLDVPCVAYLDALGQEIAPLGDFEEGIKWINEPLEFYCFQICLRNGAKLTDFVKPYKGRRSYALWSRRDVMPILGFYRGKIMRGFQRFRKT